MNSEQKQSLIESVVYLRRLSVMMEQLSIHLLYTNKENLDWLLNDIKQTHAKYLASFSPLEDL